MANCAGGGGQVRGVGLGEERGGVGVDVVRRVPAVQPVEAAAPGVVADHLQAGGGDGVDEGPLPAGEGEQPVQRRGDRRVHRPDRPDRPDLRRHGGVVDGDEAGDPALDHLLPHHVGGVEPGLRARVDEFSILTARAGRAATGPLSIPVSGQ